MQFFQHITYVLKQLHKTTFTTWLAVVKLFFITLGVSFNERFNAKTVLAKSKSVNQSSQAWFLNATRWTKNKKITIIKDGAS